MVVAVVVGALYVGLVAAHGPATCSLPGGGPCGGGGAIVGRVTPIARPALAACVAEMRGWGYASSFGEQACRQGRRQPWFRAVITNTTGATAAVLCDVDAYEHARRVARDVVLPVFIVKNPGAMFVGAHRRRTLVWYFAPPPGAPSVIARATGFVTRCRTNPSPPT